MSDYVDHETGSTWPSNEKPPHEHLIVGTLHAGHCVYCDARFPGREVQYIKRQIVDEANEKLRVLSIGIQNMSLLLDEELKR